MVRDAQDNVRLYLPHYGVVEIRMKAIDDPRGMVALWMIGYEDEPERSGEILVCEIFARDVGPDRAGVGMGLRPFGDPSIVDSFAVEPVPIDAREFHVYAVEWTPEHVEWLVDGQPVKAVHQAPAYPMQLELAIFEFPPEPGEPASDGEYPKEFLVDYVRGYRPAATRPG